MNGFVKWFSEEKGFGFVSANNKDYFIHYKQIKVDGFKTLNPGDKVHFTPENSDRGPLATNLTVVND